MAAHDETPHAMPAAPAEAPSAQWLAMEAGGGRYLVALAQAGEIFPWTAVQPTPYTRPWFLGVANLRGTPSGVVDLAHFLAEDGLGVRSDAPRSEARLLSFHTASAINCALLVDRMAGLCGAEAFVRAEPRVQDAPAYFGPRHTDAAGLAWQELNLQVLAQAPSFLAIDA
ncbi:chemotaxis protein CheW [Pseudorhodoferax sp.]|uniref:chemotaxis protein CheW n=1 Tax=Pseudorhodoferax sp. TaxID=1993553 RepID=UPI002DD62A32|nr:chemotaxis protein CheW [Pseudorhodoferax sp.]